jgi:hypothetical protein
MHLQANPALPKGGNESKCRRGSKALINFIKYFVMTFNVATFRL